MLLNELNLKALNVSAETVLPLSKNINVEGYEITFNVTHFQSGFGSGKKTVISGSITRKDNGTEKVVENADIEKVRRVVSSLCELTSSGRTTERKPRALKVDTEVKKVSDTLKVVRRLYTSSSWVRIDINKLRAEFKSARQIDREKQQKALQEKAVAPILERVARLSPEERALLVASLQ